MATPMTRDEIDAWGMDERACRRWDHLPNGEPNALRKTCATLRLIAGRGHGAVVPFSQCRGRDRAALHAVG